MSKGTEQLQRDTKAILLEKMRVVAEQIDDFDDALFDKRLETLKALSEALSSVSDYWDD